MNRVLNSQTNGITTLKQVPLLPLKHTLKSRYFGHLPYLKELMKAGDDNGVIITVFKNKFQFYSETQSKIYKMVLPGHTSIFTKEPEFYKEVLGIKQKNFTNGKNFKLVFGYFFPNAVIVVDGEKWQSIRKIIQSAINKTSIDPVIPVICNIVDNQMDPENINNSYTYDVVSRITFDVFNTVMYGWNPNSICGDSQSNFILRNCEIISQALGTRGLQLFPSLWKLPRFENIRIDAAAANLKNFSNRFIQNKKEYLKLKVETKERSMIEELIAASNLEEKGLSSEELYDNISTIFFAAFDTTSSTLRYMLYYLAKYPHFQEQLRKEILEKFPKGIEDIKKATSSQIESIVSLSNFIDEVNRLNPLIPHIARHTLEDTEIMGYEIKKGWNVIIDSHSVGQDPQYWKGQTDLKSFRPDRWNEHRPSVLNSVLPFGFGGRVCPGKRVALLEIKSLISAMLTKFKITLRNPNDKLELEISIGITIKKKACNININRI